MNDEHTQRDHRGPDAPRVAEGSTRPDPQAMGDQPIDDIRSSLPPGAGTKPADARGDVDRLEPYDEQIGGLRMSDADNPPGEPQEGAPPGAGTGDDTGASAPGLGVVDDDEDLPAAPEPNEPA